MNQKLLALYGLKWNPFTPEVPIEALHVPPKVENFCWRIEQAHLSRVNQVGSVASIKLIRDHAAQGSCCS